MLTQADETTLVRHGTRLRAEHLVQQVAYTLEVANADGAGLWGLLVPGYADAVRDAMRSIELRRHDKTVAAEESRLATLTQNDWVAEAKVWRRKAAASARRATRFGKEMPDKLLRISGASSVQALLGQLTDMVDLLEHHSADIPGPVRALITEGRNIVHRLSSADAKQEAKRLAELPRAVRAYYADKGRLYLALKAINDAGHQLHAADAPMAARYNLAILHRRRPAKAPSEVLDTQRDALPSTGP